MSWGKYMLQGRLAVPCHDEREWGRWMESADRHVAQEFVGTYLVSTVFLGLDHAIMSNDPLLFETMVFPQAEWVPRKWVEDWGERCGTWDEAVDMHERGVAHAQSLLRQLPAKQE